MFIEQQQANPHSDPNYLNSTFFLGVKKGTNNKINAMIIQNIKSEEW